MAAWLTDEELEQAWVEDHLGELGLEVEQHPQDRVYECEIAVVVTAASPEEAASAAQDIIDCNTERWAFDVRELDSGDTFEGVMP